MLVEVPRIIPHRITNVATKWTLLRWRRLLRALRRRGRSSQRGPEDRVYQGHMPLYVPRIWPLLTTNEASKLLVQIEIWMFCMGVVQEQLSFPFRITVFATPRAWSSAFGFGPVDQATSHVFLYVDLASIWVWVDNLVTTFAFFLLVQVRHGVSCFGRHDLANGPVWVVVYFFLILDSCATFACWSSALQETATCVLGYSESWCVWRFRGFLILNIGYETLRSNWIWSGRCRTRNSRTEEPLQWGIYRPLAREIE